MSATPEFRLPEWAEIVDAESPRERYVVATGDGEFTVHTHGAQVTSWRCRGRDRLWTSSTTEYAAGTAIRGGVPVVFPWFGNGPDGQLRPSHGPARLASWELVGWGTDSGDDVPPGVSLEFALGERDLAGAAGPELHGAQGWPRGIRADLQARLAADSLTVTLTLFNGTDAPVTCEAALHTYLAVSSVETATVEHLDGVPFHDKVANRDDVQHGQIPFGDEIDRIYATTNPVVLHDGPERLLVESAGATHTVVWNPGRDKGPVMADVSNWRGFLCIEAAAIGPAALTIPPRSPDDVPERLPGLCQLGQTLTLLAPKAAQ